jgi:hypothetical protein
MLDSTFRRGPAAKVNRLNAAHSESADFPRGISQGGLVPPRVAVTSQNLSVLAVIAFSGPEHLKSLSPLDKCV